MARAFILALCVLFPACTGARSVRVQPPTPAPAGLFSGYGVEKAAGNPERARKAAYLKALDDLLAHSGLTLVSKTIPDRSRMFQPSFTDTGIDHGLVWVLLAMTGDDIERGRQEFAAWRAERMEDADKLFQDAKGPERVSRLKASLALLEDAGAAGDPGTLYDRVKAALDTETARIGRLEKFQKGFRAFVVSGQLDAAEADLNEAQLSGLDQATYLKCMEELSDRRAEARRLIAQGDELFRAEHFKKARARYEQARKIDRDNGLAASKIASAERFEHEAHVRNVNEILSVVVPVATQVVGDYLEFKREEERRKREEAERAAEEARRKQQEQEKQGSRERDQRDQRDQHDKRDHDRSPRRPQLP